MATGVKLIHSHRTWAFKKMMEELPLDIRRLAEEKYEIFKDNPMYPSLRFRVIEKTRSNPLPRYELTVTRLTEQCVLKMGILIFGNELELITISTNSFKS